MNAFAACLKRPDLPFLVLLGIGASLSACGDDGTAPTMNDVGPPADMFILSGDEQSDTVLSTLAEQLTVKVVDSAGAGVRGIFVEWDAIGPGAASEPTESSTDSLGTASTAWSLSEIAGDQTLQASGASLDVQFTAHAAPGRPVDLVVTPESLELVGMADTATIEPTVQDAYGNVREVDVLDWQSLDPDVATVDSEGLVRAWSTGETEIVVSSGDLQVSVAVSVLNGRDDAGRILFGRFDPSTEEVWLYSIKSDGTDRTLVDSVSSHRWEWSPDGEALTYMRFVDGTYEMVWKAFGQEEAAVFFDGSGYGPTWSPDSRSILYQTVGGTDLRIFTPATGATRTVVSDGVNRFTGKGPDWSPVGGRIAWTSYLDGTFKLYSIQTDGSDRRKLTEPPHDGRRSPSYSPDGRWIAFVDPGLSVIRDSTGAQEQMLLGQAILDHQWMADSEGVTATTESDGVWVLDRTTGGATQILGDSVDGARWSPEESSVAYVVEGKGLWIMNPDGSGSRALDDDPNIEGWIRWQPSP